MIERGDALAGENSPEKGVGKTHCRWVQIQTTSVLVRSVDHIVAVVNPLGRSMMASY